MTMTAGDAYRTALTLTQAGHLDSDAVTTADIDAAADLAGSPRPDHHTRTTVRDALDAITDAR